MGLGMVIIRGHVAEEEDAPVDILPAITRSQKTGGLGMTEVSKEARHLHLALAKVEYEYESA